MMMLKAIHAQEGKEAVRKKSREVVEKLRKMKLTAATKKLEDSIEETLTYMDFPQQHWLKIRTNNVIERLNRKLRRRTRVVGAFPGGNSALMLACARLRYVAGNGWGARDICAWNILKKQRNNFKVSLQSIKPSLSMPRVIIQKYYFILYEFAKKG